MQWTRRHTIALAATVLALGAMFLVKHQCTTHDWNDHYQYRHYCYSDILPIYQAHGHDRDVVPYLQDSPDGVNEYPVLTGFYAHGAALLTSTKEGFMVVSFLGLVLAGAATSWALWRTAGLAAVLAWTLAPSLVAHGLTNWDLLAVAAATLGWYAWTRGRHFGAAALFGIGGAAKLYPAFFLPLVFVAALRADLHARRPDAARKAWVPPRAAATVAGGIAGFGLPNLLVYVQAPHNWWATWRFHGDRHPDFETPWEAFLRPLLQPLFPAFDWAEGWAGLVGVVGMLALVGATIAMGWRVWRGASPLAAGGAVVLVFLLTNRVYSPQYTLWALPILILLGASWRPSVLFVAADFVNFIVRYKLFTSPPGAEGWDLAWEPWSTLAVNLRWLFLAWATWTVLRKHNLIGPTASETDDAPPAAQAGSVQEASGPDATERASASP